VCYFACLNEFSDGNGFCHWETPAWQSPEGWVPSQANFTSLADPKAVGSGLTALTTLMHEAGHAAHFANVVQKSPLFSQERAPTRYIAMMCCVFFEIYVYYILNLFLYLLLETTQLLHNLPDK
jgi:hypothetical protein